LVTGRLARVATPTFIPSKEIAAYFDQRGYRLLASPTLYPVQVVRARLSADANNAATVMVRLYARHYNEDDDLELIGGQQVQIAPGASVALSWKMPDMGGQPIACIGIEVTGEKGVSGTVYLDYLTWNGVPDMTLNRPQISEAVQDNRRKNPIFWKKAWIHALDSDERFSQRDYWQDSYRLIQNQGRGMLIQGTRDWMDYQLTVTAKRCCLTGIRYALCVC
jgi:hypothetical protein